jgi:hypothetical protein
MIRRMRALLAWSPCWEGPTEEWAKRFLWKNRWRCDRIHDTDDLLQDAYLTFLRVANRYPRVMGQGPFMALFRTAMTNEMHDRARYMRRKREQHQDTSVDAGEITGRIGDLANEGYLSLLIETAPQELQLALLCIIQNPPELACLPNRHENLNMRLRRVLGYDSNVDLTGELRSLLRG